MPSGTQHVDELFRLASLTPGELGKATGMAGGPEVAPRGIAPGGTDGPHQGDADLVEVEAVGMAVVAMIAERFPMVRGDDHHCVVEKSLAS